MSIQVIYKSIVGIPVATTGVSTALDTSDIGPDRTLVVSGTAVGTYQLEGSNDAGASFVSVGSPVTNKGSVIVAAAFKLMRLNCTASTSGTPTAQVSGIKVASVG